MVVTCSMWHLIQKSSSLRIIWIFTSLKWKTIFFDKVFWWSIWQSLSKKILAKNFDVVFDKVYHKVFDKVLDKSFRQSFWQRFLTKRFDEPLDDIFWQSFLMKILTVFFRKFCKNFDVFLGEIFEEVHKKVSDEVF